MRTSLALAALLLLPNAAGLARAATVTVGDPRDPAGLCRAFEAAHKNGATDITIAPGTYDLPARDTETFRLAEWTDATVHARGVTMIFQDTKHTAVLLWHCRNVTWDGGTLRFVRPAFTQGRVRAMGQDALGKYCDWQVDAGYATGVSPVRSTFNVVEPATRVLKPLTGDWTPSQSEQRSPGNFHLRYPSGDEPHFAVGDWLVTRASAGDHLFHLDDSRNCTLENVTIQNAGFAAIFETSGGGNHFLRFSIGPGPRPAGAAEDQLVGCGADGIHSANTVAGPDIEDGAFSGLLLDDCIAIHGGFSRVLSSEGRTIVLGGGGRAHAVVGEPLRISNTAGFFAQALCTAVTELPDHSLRVTLDQDLNVPIDHSQDNNKALGTKANNPLHCGRGYKILRCRLGHTRSRGILVKADDGLIDGCTIEGCGMSGVSIGPEFWWDEANYAWNVAVRNNTFRRCCQDNSDQGSLWLHGDGAIGNRNIKIENNRFEEGFGRYVLRLENADGVDVTGNQFIHCFPFRPSSPPSPPPSSPEQTPSVVWLNHTKAVTLRRNMEIGLGPETGRFLELDPSVDPRQVQNDHAAGAGAGAKGS